MARSKSIRPLYPCRDGNSSVLGDGLCSYVLEIGDDWGVRTSLETAKEAKKAPGVLAGDLK